VRSALGARRDPLTGHRTVPSESTIRRTLGRVDDREHAHYLFTVKANQPTPAGVLRRLAVA